MNRIKYQSNGQTRRQVQIELLERLERGPSFGHTLNAAEQEIVNAYQRWLSSWITPSVELLLPELHYQVRSGDTGRIEGYHLTEAQAQKLATQCRQIRGLVNVVVEKMEQYR